MRVAVAGAGSIGCYLGGRLQTAGHDIVYIGRMGLGRAIAEHGLTVSDYLGSSATIPGDDCAFTEDIEAVREADAVLVTVKSAATAGIAESLAGRLRPGALVVSLQNGIRNPAVIAQHVKQHSVIAGMVGFNVAQVGPGHFHQGTWGKLALATGAETVAQALTDSGLPTDTHGDMPAVQWGKLLVNLNNAVNALSGLPLKAELEDRDFRRVLAAAQHEALGLLRRAGQPVVSPLAAPISLMPWVLRTPNPVFTRLARQMITIDPQARSSMFDDITAGRPTEIDYINGEVVGLARGLGRNAPVNATLVDLVREITAGGRGSWLGPELLREVSDRADRCRGNCRA
ncbi:2-dehydropantoate 2-reductase [Mycobacterium sp. NPDC050853]|uniref:2-dehydropantoate 2-reductase n=1 Tax=Mycobacteriaceae TaxID=1762 RepID=UPI0015DE93BD|nr:2-dehydropantoate 2-reductase [Mycobacteroides sp. LB1]